MRVGVLFAYMDFERRGAHHRGVLQPQIGPLIAALLPPDVEVEVINDTWQEPDWNRDYDLLFISSLHSDFDRARQISHYWRRRGAKTVYGGIMASTYAELCKPFFDSVVIGDPEGSVPRLYRDFCAGELSPFYVSPPYDASAVPTPRFDLVADSSVVPLSLEATRGCPFSCEFCALTGFGTRFHSRPPELVVRDIKEGQRMLDGRVARSKLRQVVFCDNNIGGNPSGLRELCRALAPLDLRWGSSMTFNGVANLELVKAMSAAGCRFLFVGLESFNADAIVDMNKHQNAIAHTRRVMDQCRDHGILVVSGLMISPRIDDCRYIESLPDHLSRCGLHVPSFICFESPFPGTPHFHRLAGSEEPVFLPNALLRDFSGYTLVVRPKHAPLEQYISTYEEVMKVVYSWRSRMGKLAADGERFLRHGFILPAVVDAVHMKSLTRRPHPERTYVAGTDRPPPEATSVPLTDDDFVSESERRAILDPLAVTDEYGRVLPMWRRSTTVFEANGRVSRSAQAAAAS